MKTQKYNPINISCWFRYVHIDNFPFSIGIINHGLNKFNPTVTVTDTSTGSRIRVEVGITETSANQVVLSFSSASSGDITIM